MAPTQQPHSVANDPEHHPMPGPKAKEARILLLLFLAAAGVGFAAFRIDSHLRHSPSNELPYSDRFASNDNSEWSAYGGNWRVQSGVMVNDSTERGAKLVTGSPYWRDYSVDADLALRDSGDAGVIARVSQAEQGVDAYSGIYAGLRMRDQAIVLGIADHSWIESSTQQISITPDTWYHLHIELRGCQVQAFVEQTGTEKAMQFSHQFERCPEAGGIGLRSYDSGGFWKNIKVTNLDASK